MCMGGEESTGMCVCMGGEGSTGMCVYVCVCARYRYSHVSIATAADEAATVLATKLCLPAAACHQLSYCPCHEIRLCGGHQAVC